MGILEIVLLIAGIIIFTGSFFLPLGGEKNTGIDKKAAKEAYYKHLTGKAFIPSVFRQENHIDEIVGLYVPFWVFNIESEADISYDAEKILIS